MREQFINKSFRKDSLERLEQATTIIAEYQRQGYRLTVRQLYYRFVAKYNLPNTLKSYKNFAALLSDARMAGLIDWNAIEDRTRQAQTPFYFRNLKHRVESAIANYALDRWVGQDYYVELWVEKQALEGVLLQVAQLYQITLSVNRGYSSVSAMYAASKRFLEAADENKETVLLYLGDHDPSGEDMVRDIASRLETFGCQDLAVKKVALTMDQVEEYALPPNPAKSTDSRFENYAEKYGNESWELDALEPKTLRELIDAEMAQLMDIEKAEAIAERERKDKELLRKAVSGKFVDEG